MSRQIFWLVQAGSRAASKTNDPRARNADRRGITQSDKNSSAKILKLGQLVCEEKF